MSDQNGMQPVALQRPTSDDRSAWQVYWKEQGQSWRTEPEIDEERQKFLTERRCIVPDIKQGIYPFKAIKLTRADVEWLLATHENGRGPIDWSDENQRSREGLDLRGADLRQVDLSGLPLTHLRGGLIPDEWRTATVEERQAAAIHLEGADLSNAYLEE